MPVSASVMVTSQIQSTGDVHELELLILWRGTAGWWAMPSSPSSGPESSSRVSGSGVWSHRFSQGGQTFDISGDHSARTANILGRTFDLTRGNAILIDGVDSPEGPRIAGTLVVDPQLPNGADPNQILMKLGRVKELREYLRCDTPLPNPALQARLASLCALVLSQ